MVQTSQETFDAFYVVIVEFTSIMLSTPFNRKSSQRSTMLQKSILLHLHPIVDTLPHVV